jgi:hypothetical protein
MKVQILGVATCLFAAAALGAQGAGAGVPRADNSSPRQQEGPYTYTVDMKAGMQTPPIDGNASGHAKFTVGEHKLRYEIDVSGLSGPATMAHIHIGKLGMSGPPIVTFPVKASASGQISEGTIDLTAAMNKGVSADSLMVLLNNGGAYVNVHTDAHKGGEIRGQIVRN